ncbi:flagellar protein FlaG [Paenibacillus sp. MER 99-2]|uniref:flagellar protein FlaG n=1 Tax=Paenibacillus sp. MER 99-2 TaxID=2939572 RepID=UPI00203D5D38|nr:flagellar protein FlaG [Paenibacillus sp. MER 99-2]MCM3174161.1 flagellar protein FlaG [Paenibacillus sp. MER 99-2]
MNVQLSLSASGSVSGQPRSDASVTGDSVTSTPAIKNTKEMNLKELQGANVSIADEHLIKTIERAVQSLQGPQTTLEISVHEKTHDIMVKVLNRDTGELIREIPPEKTLDLVAKMMEIAGILVDEKI